MTFRDELLNAVVPAWLSGEGTWNQKLMYAQGVVLDALGDALVQAWYQKLPGALDFQSISAIGKERRLIRGRNEGDAAYALRLRGWLDVHARRGSPWALLEQLFIHYAPDNFRIQLINRTGKVYDMAADGSVTIGQVTDWNPSGIAPTQWATITLIYYAPSGYFTFPLDADAQADILAIPVGWNAAHILGRIIVLEEPDITHFWDALFAVDDTFDGTGIDPLFDSASDSVGQMINY